MNLIDSMGDFGAFVLAKNDSIYAKISTIENLNLLSLPSDTFSLQYIVSNQPFDTINHLTQLDEICTSLSNTLTIIVFDTISVPLVINQDSLVSSCNGQIVNSIFVSTDSNLVNQFVVLDTLDRIVAVSDTGHFDLSNDQEYKVIGLYIGGLRSNISIGQDLNELEGCWQASNGITVPRIQLSAGELKTIDTSGVDAFCGIDNQNFNYIPNGSANTEGNIMWYIVDTMGQVIDTSSTLPLRLRNNREEDCRVYRVAYLDGAYLPRRDENISDLEGCYEISNPIPVKKYRVEGGSILVNGTDEIDVCVGDDSGSELNFEIRGSVGNRSAWVWVRDDIITNIQITAPNNLSALPPGECQLYLLQYSDLGVQGLFVGNTLQQITGCYDYTNAIDFNKELVDGGTLELTDGDREISVCVDDTISESIDVVLTDAIGDFSTWMITSAIGEITSVGQGPPYNFEGSGRGQCFIWNVASNDILNGLEIGGFIPDIEGCHALSNPIRVRKLEGIGCLTDVDDELLSNDVVLYPNPSTGLINIASDKQMSEVVVYTMNGQKVKEYDYINSYQSTIDLSELDSGIYLIEINSRDQVVRKRVIKM